MIQHVLKDGRTIDSIKGLTIEIKPCTALYAVVRDVIERGEKERFTISKKPDLPP